MPPRGYQLDFLRCPHSLWDDDAAAAAAAAGKGSECAICKEPFLTSPPDVVRTLECEHTFHLACVDRWFNKDMSCPMCRLDLKRTSSSQRSLGRSSQRSRSSHTSSSRSSRTGQVLIGQSNSDPQIFLGVLDGQRLLVDPARGSPSAADRMWHLRSSASLAVSFSDRSLPNMGSSQSERSLGMRSSNCSLPVVQEVLDEARERDSHRSHGSTTSPGSQLGTAAPAGEAPEQPGVASRRASTPEVGGRMSRHQASRDLCLRPTSHSVQLPVGPSAFASQSRAQTGAADSGRANLLEPPRPEHLWLASHGVQLPEGPSASAGQSRAQALPPHPVRAPYAVSVQRGHSGTYARAPVPAYVIPPHVDQEWGSTGEGQSHALARAPVPAYVIPPQEDQEAGGAGEGADDKITLSVRSVPAMMPPEASGSTSSSVAATPTTQLMGSRVVTMPARPVHAGATTTYVATYTVRPGGYPSAPWPAVVHPAVHAYAPFRS